MQSAEEDRTKRDMARKGNMPLFIGDDCIEPNEYIAREEEEM